MTESSQGGLFELVPGQKLPAAATTADDGVAGSPWALPPPDQDAELKAVHAWFLRQDPRGERVGRVLRESLDQVLDGPRTMRFRYSDLRKTEKTHVGTVVEINLGKEFQLNDGVAMDYNVAGIEVDCKYSMSMGGWELPLESIGHIVLLLWANDDSSRWSSGLWRVDPAHLGHGAGNRDRKRKMVKSGQASIAWLWRDSELAENLLLHLPSPLVEKIFSHKGGRKGQQRVNELFRLVQQRIIRREVVATVAQQKDAPRRARMSREPRHLGAEGILVLGHFEWDVNVAKALRLPVPSSGEWISVRVAPCASGDVVAFEADSSGWRLARPDDPVVAAPVIPRSRALDVDGGV